MKKLFSIPLFIILILTLNPVFGKILQTTERTLTIDFEEQPAGVLVNSVSASNSIRADPHKDPARGAFVSGFSDFGLGEVSIQSLKVFGIDPSEHGATIVVENAVETPYMADCRARGIPIPPDWAETGTPWVFQGALTQNLLQPGQFAGVWTYTDPTVEGACFALPRDTAGGTPTGGLAGFICQSATTGYACFWDNKLRADPAQTPIGWRGKTLVISDLVDGSNLIENCTGCHRGNNVFLISPDDPVWAKVLRGPLSGPSTGTFTTQVKASSDNTGGHPRYIPFTTDPPRSGWANPAPTGIGCAGACHENPSLGFSAIPPMPPSCALPSTNNPNNCFGKP